MVEFFFDDDEPHAPACLACHGTDKGANALALWSHLDNDHHDETYLYLCDDCLRNAHMFAGYPTWSDEMKAQRQEILTAKKHTHHATP